MEPSAASEVEFRDPLVGRVLQDRYRVLRVIGRGGMGIVYLGEHVLIQRKVAIKMLQPGLNASEEAFHRFQREARAAAAVGNEHIVDVTDMGRLDDGRYYMVLEYLDGIDLATLIANEGPLPVQRALRIAIQILDGLAEVHAAGIVHRDLKPENIFLIQRAGRDDFVKILDFGICKVLNERALTETGIALGTPRFMSPEQLEARPEIDRRADVYAVGAILYFALSGNAPFECVSLPKLLISIWNEPAPRLRDVRPDASEALEALVTRALEKDPARRFTDSRTMRALLAEQMHGVGDSNRDAERAFDSDLQGGSGSRTPAPAPARADAPQSYSRLRFVHKVRARALACIAIVASGAALAGLFYVVDVAIETPPARHPPSRQAPRASARPSDSASALPLSPRSPEAAERPDDREAENAVPTLDSKVPRRAHAPRRVVPQLPAASALEAPVARAQDAGPQLAEPALDTPAEPVPPPPHRDPIVLPPAALKRVFGTAADR